jgi:predicted MFS family arabinose efflux permease
MASVGDLVAPRERARWQGRVASVFAGATVVGPLLGGVVVEHVSWRWVFYVNLPLGAAALVGIRRVLPASSGRPPAGPLDVQGALLLALASSAALLVLSWGGDRLQWASPETAALAVVAVAGAAAFAVRERRAADPLVSLPMLADRTVSVAAGALFLATAALFSVTVFVPVLLQAGAGFSPTAAGLTLASMTVGITAATTVAGRRIAAGARAARLPLAGAATMAAALAGVGLLAPSSPPAAIVAVLVVFGAGFGLASQLLVVAVQNAVDRRQIGVATSTAGFFRALGGATGAAVLGAVFAAGHGTVGEAARATFLVAAGVAALAAVVLLRLPGARPVSD